MSDLDQLHNRLGIQRRVFIQPSVYGHDNSLLIDAIKASSLEARGVVSLEAGRNLADVTALHKLGVRAVRYNIVNSRDTLGSVRN